MTTALLPRLNTRELVEPARPLDRARHWEGYLQGEIGSAIEAGAQIPIKADLRFYTGLIDGAGIAGREAYAFTLDGSLCGSTVELSLWFSQPRLRLAAIECSATLSDDGQEILGHWRWPCECMMSGKDTSCDGSRGPFKLRRVDGPGE